MRVNKSNLDLISLLRADDERPRSRGIHVSEIIRKLEISLGKGKKYSQAIDDMARTRMQCGFIWEKLFSRALGDLGGETTGIVSLDHPGEQCLDGIYGTPDWVIADDDGQVWLGETKMTWRLSRYLKQDVSQALQEDFWAWKVQMLAYMKMMGLSRGLLAVLFACGDYKPGPPTPEVGLWELYPETDEINRNWEMIRTASQKRG